mgnify:CR=1 FL=1
MTNVLIVEDEQAIRRFLRTALEGDGMRVYEAETLQRGLLEAATRKPDLIILDLGLPDGDGIEFYPRPAPVERGAGDCAFRTQRRER